MESKIKLLLFILPLIIMSGCMMNTGIGIFDETQVISTDVLRYKGEAFSFFLTKPLQYASLTSDASINDNVIFLNETTNCIIGDAIDIYNNESYFQSIILSKTSTNITMANTLDREFSTIDSVIKCGEWDLSTADGSTIEQIFKISPPSNLTWHITSTIIKITDNLDWDLSTFGGGSALTNGISGRIVDGVSKDLFLIYDNSGFALRGFEVVDFAKAPAGVYGFIGNLNFIDTYGTIVKLKGENEDEWQAVVRDDLTTQNEIAITINGYYSSELDFN